MKVNINGTDETLKFSMWQLEEMNRLNKDHAESISFPKVALIYSALTNNYRHQKKDCPLSIEDVELWADDLTTTDEGNKILADINNAFVESTAYKTLVKASVEIEEAKKKS
jgi:hypothetical protein